MPSTVRSNIVYAEYYQGYRERWARGNNEVVRVCDVPWAKKDAFRLDMLGFPYFDTPTNPHKLRRWLPEANPKFTNLFAMECHLLEGVGKPGQETQGDPRRISYDLARMEVVYRPVDYFIRTDQDADGQPNPELSRYVTRSQAFSVRSFTWPGNTFKYHGSDQSLPEGLSRRERSRELTYTWREVPARGATGTLPIGLSAYIDSAVGAVNSAVFDGYERGTLYCSAPEIRPYTHPAGSDTDGVPGANLVYVYDIVYKFIRLQIDAGDCVIPTEATMDVVGGHQYVYRRSSAKYEKLVNVQNSTKNLFDYFDFNKLFSIV